MHYKNGTPVREGDAVIFKRYNGQVTAGIIHTLNAGTETCNGQVASVVPGGTTQDCVTTSQIYSAADAWITLEAQQPQKIAQELPQIMSASKA